VRYDYWVVRFVPDPVRGEFVNIAVVAGAGSDWAYRRVSNLQRASRLGGSATVTHAFLARISQAIVEKLDEVEALLEVPSDRMTRGFIEDLRVRMNNVVQISPPRPVRAMSAADAADIAFELMVVDDGPVTRHRSRTLVAHRLQEAFAHDPELARHVAHARQARVEGQRIDYDVALADDVTLQLTQAWSFDLHPRNLKRLETNIQAWNYLMGLVRKEGGELIRPRTPQQSALQIPNSVDLNVLYRPPASNEGERLFDNARRGWKSLGIRAVEETETERVLQEARQLVDA
jgi:hypothetical protein